MKNPAITFFKLKNWLLPASTGSHFDFLDGLRGCAIILVISYHTFYTNPDHGIIARLIGYFLSAGWMGVPIFFVLSGFLISYPFFKKRSIDRKSCYESGYLLRRSAKILPPFYFSIFFFICFYWITKCPDSYLRSAFLWATGLGNFITVDPPFNSSYWSLIVETHFYLMLPLLFIVTQGLNITKTAIVIFLILIIIPYFSRLFAWPMGVYSIPDYHTVEASKIILCLVRFPAQLDYFAWGILFAGVFIQLTQNNQKASLRPLSLFGVLGVLLLIADLLLWGYWAVQYDIRNHPTRWSVEIAHILPSLATMLILFLIFDPDCFMSKYFAFPPLRFIGIISYEWFLFHGPIIRWFLDHSGQTHGSLRAYAWRTILPISISFVISVIVYYYFSLPILRMIRSRLYALK